MKNKLIIATFLVSLSLLVDEIALTAIFYVLIGQLNTILAISAALLGFSLSGVVVYVRTTPLRKMRPERSSFQLLFWFACVTAASTVAVMNIPLNHADFFYTPGFAVNAMKVIAYLIAAAPFFVGGVFINEAFCLYPEGISQLYCANLLGAATGCLLSIFLLGLAGPAQAMLYSCLPAALWFYKDAFTRGARGPHLLLLPGLFILILVSCFFYPLLDIKKLNSMGELRHTRYRAFTASKKDVEFGRWSSDGWTMIRSPRAPQLWENFKGWGLSAEFRGKAPRIKLINYNSRFITYVTEFRGGFSDIKEWLDSDLISLHYQIGRRYDKVLNIGAGGGREVLNALYHGAGEVTAVDVNAVTVNDIMKGHLREFSGNLFFHPKVRVIVDEGRSFIERSREKFDLIDFTIVGGLNNEKIELLSTDSLFTLEGLAADIDHLSEKGVFSYVMYSLSSGLLSDSMIKGGRTTAPFVYIPAVKTLTGLRSVLENGHPDRLLKDRVLIAGVPGVIDKNYDLIHIIVSKAPFSGPERERFIKKCRELGFIVFYPPVNTPANVYAEIVEARAYSDLSRLFPYDTAAPTDDKPFQYSFNRVRAARTLQAADFLKNFLYDPFVFNGIIFGALSFLLLCVPVARSSWIQNTPYPIHSIPAIALFFTFIGCAYMMIEMSTIMKLQIYLGKPIYAVNAALFTFMFANGGGSYSTKGLKTKYLKRDIRFIILGIAASGTLFYLFWSPIVLHTIHLPIIFRMLIAFASLFPLAWLMGMLFPSGVKLAVMNGKGLIPLAWAVNGCFSVIGLFAGRVLACHWGFNSVLLWGLVAYVLAGAAITFHRRKPLPFGSGAYR